jgi:hypothetical protein
VVMKWTFPRVGWIYCKERERGNINCHWSRLRTREQLNVVIGIRSLGDDLLFIAWYLCHVEEWEILLIPSLTI